jgi:hypothetical protein
MRDELQHLLVSEDAHRLEQGGVRRESAFASAWLVDQIRSVSTLANSFNQPTVSLRYPYTYQVEPRHKPP